MDVKNSIPIIYTRGTYYDVGYDVGRTFRSLIEDYLSSIRNEHASLLEQFSVGQGKKRYDATVETMKKSFPQYIRELQGTADGAKVPFNHLMVLHLKPRLSPGAQDRFTSSQSDEMNFGCSSVSLNLEKEVLLGHTEDGQCELINHLYIIDAHITENESQGKWGVKHEKFTALCYPGHLPGFCMGYNSHGLVYSINVLTPIEICSGKTPRHFLCRAILAAENMESVHEILKDEGVGSSDGFGINTYFVDKIGTHIYHNLEVGPSECSSHNSSQLSVFVLPIGDHLLHTNKYLHLNVKEHQTYVVKASEVRHARAKELPSPISREALLTLLSDEQPGDTFFRRTDMKLTTTTLGLFDIIKKTWTLWMGNPKENDPVCILPITFKWD